MRISELLLNLIGEGAGVKVASAVGAKLSPVGPGDTGAHAKRRNVTTKMRRILAEIRAGMDSFIQRNQLPGPQEAG